MVDGAVLDADVAQEDADKHVVVASPWTVVPFQSSQESCRDTESLFRASANGCLGLLMALVQLQAGTTLKAPSATSRAMGNADGFR